MSAWFGPARAPQTPEAGWARQPWLRDLSQVLSIGVIVGLLLYLMRGRYFWAGMLYAICISTCIGFTIGILQKAVSRWLLRRHPDDPRLLAGWPGWPWMLPCVLLGALFGHELGTVVASALLGHSPRGLFSGGPQKLLLGGGFTLLVSLVAVGYFYARERLHHAELSSVGVQRQAAEAQLLALQTQIEPHMLFNTLAHLRALIKLRPDDALTMLDELIAYLRATLQASRVPLHPLGTEFERLRDYLTLMQRRMGARLRVELDLPSALAEQPVPPLLLQPLVENAIKHGLEPAVDGGWLRVRAALRDGRLCLTVDDDGMGLGASPAVGTQFGTQQVRDRLRTQYGQAARFSLEPLSPRGCRATIELPA